jgi:CDP-diacylglycerol--glycerol-3-phosphate 3-phosphatidyltransferase
MANLITFLRFPLLFLYLILIYFGGTTAQLWSIPLVAIIFFMDSVDGFIARLRGEVSLLGSAFDIATDRTMEIVLWVVFADLKLIPIAVPVIAIVRGTTVDAIRAVGIGNGLPAFDQVHHPISRLLVSSRGMRDFYGVTKGLTFILLSASLWARSAASPYAGLILKVSLILTWVVIATMIARGLPVLIEGYSSLKVKKPSSPSE